MEQYSIEKYKSLPERKCHNCEYEYKGFFCPRCGQRHMESRFTTKESSLWFFDQVFNLEKGLTYTIKELFLHPGQVIHDYLNRATVRFMHPFRFVFLLASVSALLTILTGAFESPEVMEMIEGSAPNEETKEFYKAFVTQTKKYLAFIMMLSIPIYAIGSFLVYKNKGFNFAEHLIINCYAYGFTMLLSIPLIATLLFSNGMYIHSILSTPIYIIGMVYVFTRFFKENAIKTFFKVIMVFVVGIFFSLILGGILGALFILIKYLF